MLFLLPFLVLAACQDNGNTSREEVREGAREAVDAPANYLSANLRAQQQAQATTAVATVNNAIRLFQASEGRNPHSLEELQETGYLPAVPDLPRDASFRYDAQTGEVSIEGN